MILGEVLERFFGSDKTRKSEHEKQTVGAGEARGEKLGRDSWFKRQSHFPAWWDGNK